MRTALIVVAALLGIVLSFAAMQATDRAVKAQNRCLMLERQLGVFRAANQDICDRLDALESLSHCHRSR